MTTQLVLLPGVGLVLLTAMMVGLWLLAMRIHNAAVVDVGWGSAMVVLGTLYFALGDGPLPRRAVACAIAVLWGARLALHLLTTRIIGQQEEGRYQSLREEWGDAANRKLLGFFLMQALIAVVISVAYLLPATAHGPAHVPLHFLEWLGVALWLVGFMGEAAADHQLKRFKANPANEGRVCTIGLWHYSRHPNYFFEWLMWVGLAAFALASPWGWLAIISPLIMTFFLFRVTGIPATEQQAVRSKGDAYRQYQRTTSVFFPWFPKQDSHNG